MAAIDDFLPSSGPEQEACRDAEALATTALLNCLIREVAAPLGDGGHVLPATGHVLRTGGGRFPAEPALRTPAGWRPLALEELVGLAVAELRAGTGVANDALPAEIRHSRDVMATLLATRRTAVPPADPYLRSEQALVAGHRYHPAPKARGGGGPAAWLPYAPEAHASFALPLLGVPARDLVEEGDAGALDGLGPPAGDGLALLPAHPWQVELLGGLRDGRLRHLGATAARAVPTSSIRTVYLPEPDLFCKFSLDLRITNDVRRLWLRDLRRLSLLAGLLGVAFDDLPEHVPRPAVLRDRGYRSAELGRDGGEALAVIVRDGLREHLLPGLTALLAAGVSEGFPGNPLDGLGLEGALTWWEGYLGHLVPPVLHAYLRHGVVLECHLQNVLIAVDGYGAPAQVIFRDHEGVKLVADRYPLLRGGHLLGRTQAWERLVYCLLTNNLCEIAGAVTARHPGLRAELWARARTVFAACGKEHGDPEELRDLLAATHVPAKANLLLRWLDADGGAMRCVPVPNPLRPPFP
ncbi:IucA/IucC family C-terminal-domain containing protein [Nonomuraea jiangxiensis]|uniref:Siderophore synthetase component n=1 Tax=Nonomuraea jiangxiensis TaxID=633440 RepID=A0A1G8SZ99_9ACTN|nr:IucA/IucC family C-terminal-domain containing protein [Nonomuraea jiangxiensis]SDJ34125.1 Siderophore synthetase component [Nonomuraea jiangxiensis]